MIDKYPHHQDDVDDHPLAETDTFERMKPFQAKKKDVVGSTTVVPLDDNDGVLHYYDINGESLYTNPPDCNLPTIDHGLDQDKVWAFRLTAYNQLAIINNVKRNPLKASQASHIPFWGEKLTTPVFYDNEKYQLLFKQWKQRIGLEFIKLRHAEEARLGDSWQRKQQK